MSIGRAAVLACATLLGAACWTGAVTTHATSERKPVKGKPTPRPRGTIRGVVRDAGSGDPLRGVTVTTEVSGRRIFATTNDDGVYELENLPAGTYTVEFVGSQGRDRVDVTLESDADAVADIMVFFQPSPAP